MLVLFVIAPVRRGGRSLQRRRGNPVLVLLVITMLFVFGCAKQPTRVAGQVSTGEVPMTSDVSSFKGLAYVAIERYGVKWASNVLVIVKRPGGLRLDAIEKITDVVATLSAKEGRGYLSLPLENKKYPLENNQVKFPKIGDIPITMDFLADILVGRPTIQGFATVSESFHLDKGSYFIKGVAEDMEMSSVYKLPLVYTCFTSKDKKRILFEVDFYDFVSFDGKNFPKRVIVRFENPKMVMDVRYKDMQPEATVPWGLIKN